MQGLYMTMMTFRLSNVSISFPTIHTHTQVSGWRQAPSCKLWLQTIKNYARDCFQAFAHCNLEWLSCFPMGFEQMPFLGQVAYLDLLFCTGFDS